MLIVLLSGAGLLLVIAAVNVASLLLVRSESRRREVAIRTALGASAVRVIRQFVTEAIVLVALGTVLGLVSAYWAVQLLTQPGSRGHHGRNAVSPGPRDDASGRGICECAGGCGRRTLRNHSDAADVDRGHGGASGIGQPWLRRQHVAAHRSEARRPRTCDRDGAARRRRTPRARASTAYSEWTPGCRWITWRRSPSMRRRTVTRPTSSKRRSSGRSRTALRCCRGCSRSGSRARRRSSAATRCGSGSRAAPITVSTTRCNTARSARATFNPAGAPLTRTRLHRRRSPVEAARRDHQPGAGEAVLPR